MISITVTGDRRGEGKTVTALRIVHMLRSLGFQTEYQGGHGNLSRELNDLTPDELVPMLEAAKCPLVFQVIDRT